MIYAQYNLIFKHLASLGRSSKHNDYIWDDACITNDCVILARGFYSALNEYQLQLLDIYNLIIEDKIYNFEDLNSRKEELMSMGNTLINLYESDIKDLIRNDAYIVIWITTAYCVLVLLLYFVVYVRSLNNIQREITNIWSLGRLIPIDHRNKIMRAMKAHAKLDVKKAS